ncbi:MAG: hypothetical protein ABI324_24175 [Ktedonobacteraceae bacterium]
MKQPQLQYHEALSCLVAACLPVEAYRCWRNAVLAMCHFPEMFATGYYHEGWIVVPLGPTIKVCEHGWCSLADTRIDPSIVLITPPQQPVEYFSGMALSHAHLRQTLAGRTLPLVCHTDYGPDGMEHAGYKAAYDQAMKRACDLATEQHLSPEAIHVCGKEPDDGWTILKML